MSKHRNHQNTRGSTFARSLLVIALIGVVVFIVYTASTPEKKVEDITPEVTAAKTEPEPSKEKPPELLPSKVVREAEISSGLVGAKVCSECHPGEAALQARSGHSHTLRHLPVTSIARWLEGKTVKDPEDPESAWSFATAHGTLEAQRSKGKSELCFPVDFVVGSGGNGMTFMSIYPSSEKKLETTALEHRLSYYAEKKKLGVTPGQGKDDPKGSATRIDANGRSLDEPALVKCLDCHSTVTSSKGSGKFDLATLVPNVTCERCHGPGTKHVEAARAGSSIDALKMPLGLDDSGPLRQIELCGQCHRRPDTVSPAMLDINNPEIARFQPVGLALSFCFKKGKSGLSCSSCHDPHAKVVREKTHYEAVCLSCHSSFNQRVCSVSPTDKCIDCHMPKKVVSVDFRFTDHWIRVQDRKQKVSVPTPSLKGNP